jgi:hypothetical protein
MKAQCACAILVFVLALPLGAAENSNTSASASIQPPQTNAVVQDASPSPPPKPLTKQTVSPQVLFQAGNLAYRSGEYGAASAAFRDSARAQPASGTLQNLGLAEWQRGQPGLAILAWEQAQWLDSFNRSVRGDLRFARKTAQVETPNLAWYEVVSTWLPASWWAWIGALSFWIAVGATLLPAVFRWQKRGWHQAIAAGALTLFLRSLPAWFGIQTRSQMGFVLQKDCPLRLTPTAQAQVVTRLSAGEPVRLNRSRGDFCLVQTSRISGWINRNELGLITQKL